MHRLREATAALSGLLDRFCGWLALAAFFVMLVAMLVQIVARYGFSMPPAWTEELARYAMIWGAMPGAAMAYYRRADPVLFRASTSGRPRLALAMQLVEGCAVLALCAPVLFYAPAFLARHSHRITETLEVNSALVVAIIPACLGIIVIHLFTRLIAAVCDVWPAKVSE